VDVSGTELARLSDPEVDPNEVPNRLQELAEQHANVILAIANYVWKN
jgi:hypothetical protein